MAAITDIEKQIAELYRAGGQKVFWLRSFKEPPEIVLPQLRVLQRRGKLTTTISVFTEGGRVVWTGREAEYAREKGRGFEHLTTDSDPLDEAVGLAFRVSPSWELELQC